MENKPKSKGGLLLISSLSVIRGESGSLLSLVSCFVSLDIELILTMHKYSRNSLDYRIEVTHYCKYVVTQSFTLLQSSDNRSSSTTYMHCSLYVASIVSCYHAMVQCTLLAYRDTSRQSFTLEYRPAEAVHTWSGSS